MTTATEYPTQFQRLRIADIFKASEWGDLDWLDSDETSATYDLLDWASIVEEAAPEPAGLGSAGTTPLAAIL